MNRIPWLKNGDHPSDFVGSIEYYDEYGILCVASESDQRRAGLEGGVVGRFSGSDRLTALESVCGLCGKYMKDHGVLKTVDGELTVCPGDVIVEDLFGNRRIDNGAY